jgi:general secretion pathway protein D
MRSVVRRELVSERMLNLRLRRITHSAVLLVVASLLAACHQTNTEFEEGRKAEALQDYDTALVYYQRAAQANPTDAEYKLREMHMRYAAASWHMEQGRKAVQKADLQLALSEFEKAAAIDPSNMAAEQQAKSTAELLTAVSNVEKQEPDDSSEDEKEMLAGPPRLKPLSQEPLNLKMTNDSKVVFETMAKLAGLSVIFDPDYVSHRVTVDLPGVTLEQGLDAVSFESKAFWKPLTSSVIEVAPDSAQKRKDIEDEVVGTFYISNSLTQQDLTEIVNGLRQLLDLHRVQQVNAQNAIVIRDTPDKLELASKIIRDIDKAKPEVLLHVQVLSADRDRLRQLGILPGQNVSLTFNPRCSVQPTNSGCSSSSSTASTTSTSPLQITLNNLQHLATADYSLTLPGASAEAILTDSKTKIIQDPEIRVTDGEKATLKIGQRVPVATGSTQAATGVAATTAVSSLVNTQFSYIDVGVNIEAQPRVHPDGEVSMKLVVEISSVANFQNIGGIQEPVISQRKIEHEVRLKDGEVNILGGLIERTDTDSLNGIPGAADVPGLKYLFSQVSKEVEHDEVLIVLTPHILRFPSINAENLRRLAAGTDSNVRVFHAAASDAKSSDLPTRNSEASPDALHSGLPAGTQLLEQVREQPVTVVEAASANGPAASGAGVAAQVRFNPAQVTLKSGDTEIVGISIDGVNDLSSMPMLLKYDPAVIQITEVRDGGFLSGGTQTVAIVQRIDAQKGEVMISCTRGPHTAGVNGSGTILGLVVKGVAAGDTRIQIVELKAQDSQQRNIPITSGDAAIRVQ